MPDSSIKPDQLHDALHHDSLLAMNFLNEICVNYPDAISFAPGRPLEDDFNHELLSQYLDIYVDYLRRKLNYSEREIARVLFQYGKTSGIIQPLIARHLANDEGITADPDDIVVTVGAQEAMLITLRVLCTSKRDAVLVPEPCYVGIVGAARLLDITIVPVKESHGTLEVKSVAEACASARKAGLNPVLLYLVPGYANPSGVCLSLEVRLALLRYVSEHKLYILEDNPYGLFARQGSATVATLKSLDSEKRVIYVGSFSKTCFPGARIGYLYADQVVEGFSGGKRISDVFSSVKSMLTVNTPPIAQAVIGGMLLQSDCTLTARNRRNIKRYSDNLLTLANALQSNFPNDSGVCGAVNWNLPDGGFFTVVNVPFIANAAALERSAQKFGILWTPMQDFYLEKGGERSLRLSSSLLSGEEIQQGIKRFKEFVISEIALQQSQ